MRNLKKLLCLVLAVAMMASMFVIGASAAEKAYSETTKYSEAAAVITADAVKVMDGYEDGTMRYDAPVTREQAATIICKILLGTTAAENLKTGSAPFADVPASRWSAGYIAYLKAQGIVSGVTDTTFNPTAGVTGVQFAKMLLSAVGYGANNEFDGAAWDINTISQANASGLFTSTKAADLTAGATREECMLYAFNTMTKVPTVKYNKTFDSYYVGPSALQSVTDDVDPTDVESAYKYTLAYTNFKLAQEADGGADVYGRPSTSWTVEGNIVAKDVASKAPVATLTTGVNSAAIYTAVGKAVVNDLNKDLENYITVYVDGAVVDKPIVGMGGAAGFSEIKAGEVTVNGFATGGATAELYTTKVPANGATPAHWELTVVVTNEYIAKVTRATATELTLSTRDTVSADDVNIAGIAKNDYVIYTKGLEGANTVVTAVRKAEPVVGAYSGNSTVVFTKYYTIGGKPYAVAAVGAMEDPATVLGSNFGTSYDVYLSSLGYILRVEVNEDDGASGNYNYLYVTALQADVSGKDLINADKATIAVEAVYADGGKEVLYYDIKTSTSKDYDDADGKYIVVDGKNIPLTDANVNKIKDASATLTSVKGESVTIGGWMSYTKNSSGAVTLRNLNASYAKSGTDVTITTNRIALGNGYTANSKTVLNVVDAKGNVKTYTGTSKFPNIEAGNVTLVTYSSAKSTTANTIVVFDGEGSSIQTRPVLAYCAAYIGDDADGKAYSFYVNGATERVVADADYSVGHIYTMTEGNDGYEVVDEVSNAVFGDDAVVSTEGIVNGMEGFNYGYGAMQPNLTWKYYENAVIATLNDNSFVTAAVSAEDAEDSNVGKEVPSYTYYFDKDTVIIDVRTGENAGKPAELAEGSVFMAAVENDVKDFEGVNYCTYIWIVG